MTLLSFSQQSNLTTTTGIAESGTPPVGDVFELPEIGLSFTPCHGSMMAFRASEVVHGTRIPDLIGQGCQRIGSSIAVQRRAMNVAIKHHKEMKARVAEEQDTAIAIVKKRHAQGVDRHGQPLKRIRRAT